VAVADKIELRALLVFISAAKKADGPGNWLAAALPALAAELASDDAAVA